MWPGAAGRADTTAVCRLRGACTSAGRRSRRWVRTRDSRSVAPSASTAPPWAVLRVGVAGLAGGLAEGAAQPGLLVDLSERGFLVTLAGVGLALGEAPVAAGPVHQQDARGRRDRPGSRCRPRPELHRTPYIHRRSACAALGSRPRATLGRGDTRRFALDGHELTRDEGGRARSRACAATARRRRRPGVRRGRPAPRPSPAQSGEPPCRTPARPPRPRSGSAWRGCARVELAVLRSRTERPHRVAQLPPRFANEVGELELVVFVDVLPELRRAAPRRRAVEQREVAVGTHLRGAARRGVLAVLRSASSSCLPSSCRRAGARRGAPRAGRGAPRCRALRRADAPSHSSSSRIGSLHASSRTGPKVRRSERSRRVATRAWCTASGSLPSRTPGSLPISRGVEVAIAAWTTSAGVDAKSSGRGGTRSGGSAARGPSARTILGTGSGCPAPAARSRATSAATSVGGADCSSSTSSSRNRAASRHPVEHRHFVVDDLADRRTLFVAEHDAVPHRVESCNRSQRRAVDEREHEVDGGSGWFARLAVDMQLVAGERPRILGDRQLHRPALVVAVAQARAGTGKPEVVGVEVGGLEPDRVGRVGTEAVDGAQVGQLEERSRRELELVFDGHDATRSCARDRSRALGDAVASSRRPRSASSATCRRRRAPTPACRRRG